MPEGARGVLLTSKRPLCPRAGSAYYAQEPSPENRSHVGTDFLSLKVSHRHQNESRRRLWWTAGRERRGEMRAKMVEDEIADDDREERRERVEDHGLGSL